MNNPVCGSVHVHKCAYVKLQGWSLGFTHQGLSERPGDPPASPFPTLSWQVHAMPGFITQFLEPNLGPHDCMQALDQLSYLPVLGKGTWKRRMVVLEESWIRCNKDPSRFPIVLSSPAGGMRSCRLRRERGRDDKGKWKVRTSLPSLRAMRCLISGTRRVWIAYEAANLTRGLFYTWNYDLITLIRISLWPLVTDSGWCHRPGIRIWCFRVESNTRKMKENTLYWQPR